MVPGNVEHPRSWDVKQVEGIITERAWALQNKIQDQRQIV